MLLHLPTEGLRMSRSATQAACWQLTSCATTPGGSRPSSPCVSMRSALCVGNSCKSNKKGLRDFGNAALPCIPGACSPYVHVCRPSNTSFDVGQGMMSVKSVLSCQVRAAWQNEQWCRWLPQPSITKHSSCLLHCKTQMDISLVRQQNQISRAPRGVPQQPCPIQLQSVGQQAVLMTRPASLRLRLPSWL